MTVSRREFFKIGSLSVGAFGFTKSLFSKSRGQSGSKLENMVADVKPLTPEDYKMRLARSKRLMAENNIDGLLLTGSTDLVYFTNVQWGRSERTFGAVLNQKKDPVWICPAFERKRAEERKNKEIWQNILGSRQWKQVEERMNKESWRNNFGSRQMRRRSRR